MCNGRNIFGQELFSLTKTIPFYNLNIWLLIGTSHQMKIVNGKLALTIEKLNC